MSYLVVWSLHLSLIVSTVCHLEKALLNLNGACDLHYFFTRQIILIMITDITSSVLDHPCFPVPTFSRFLFLLFLLLLLFQLFLDSYISIITTVIMNEPEHKNYGNLSFGERSVLKDHKSNLNLIIRSKQWVYSCCDGSSTLHWRRIPPT